MSLDVLDDIFCMYFKFSGECIKASAERRVSL